jgi:hypothetical protein
MADFLEHAFHRLLASAFGTQQTALRDRRTSALRGKSEVGIGQFDFCF